MKTLILSFIIFSKAILQSMVDRPDVVKVEFAVKILKIFKRDNKSLCILSNEDSTNFSVQSYFSRIMKEINSNYVGYDEDLLEEDFENIFKAYHKLFRFIDRCIEILVTHLIPENCRVQKPENNDLSKLLVDNLISNLNDFNFSSSGEMLAIACMYEMFYNELIEYSGFVNKYEQWLIDIYIYNLNVLQRSRDSLDIISNQYIITRAQEFIGRVLGARQTPGMLATSCLVSKSFDSYDKTGLESILRYYIIIVNELKNNESETCELSRLENNRYKKLINTLSASGKLDEIQTGAILLGFQQFYEYMDNAHLYLILDLYSKDHKYISRQCNFDHQQFLNDYPKIINEVLNNLQSEESTDLYTRDLVKYCMLNNIRNKKDVNVDHTILSKLDEIINAYNDFTYSFHESQCQTNPNRCHKMTINNLRRDSEEIDLIYKNSYMNQSVLYCKVKSREYKHQNNSHVDILHNFLYKYTYSFCPHKLSYIKLFADGISQDLFSVINDRIVSLRSIENYVSEFLDKSVDNFNVTSFSGFKYQDVYCHIKHNINYSLIDFDDVNKNHDYNKIKENILQKCSLIHSIAKYVDDFNSYIDLDDWLLLLDTSINFINNVSYISLTDNEKFNALKNSIYSNLTAYKSSAGRQKRMDCEIEKITKEGLEDLSIETMKNIYLHLAFKYSNSNCLLDTSMFRKKKIQNLVSHLKQYPNFEVLDDTKIRAYILYLNRIILNVSTELLSYDYPDMVASNFVDPVTCKYQKTSEELNSVLLTYLENKYKDKEMLWMNHVHLYKCLLLKDTRSFLSELHDNNQLSTKEIDYITDLYHSTLAAHPNLNEKSELNRAKILELLNNSSQLIDFESNKIKLLMVYCHIRKLHTIIIMHTTSQEPSSISSTEGSSTTDMVVSSHHNQMDQSSVRTTITYVSLGNSTTYSTIKPELSKGAIAGIVIGSIAIICIFVCLMIYYYVYRRKN